MATNSMQYVKENNLFEEAKERYEKTSRRWKAQWWAVIEDIYNRCKEWRAKYILENETVLERIKKTISGIVEKVPIIFAKGSKLCYLFKFYDSDGNLLFSKIGTTARTITTRLKEEIKQYSKNYDIEGVVIESVIDCGDIPPEGAESEARAKFIQQCPSSYIKNDRFLEFDIAVEDFNNCILSYLNKCPTAA